MLNWLNVKNSNFSGYIFWGGLFISVLIPFLFYKSLNRVIEDHPHIATTGNENIIYNFDVCENKNGHIKIFGWATPVDGRGILTAFATVNGKQFQLRTMVNTRKDVSQAMNKPGLYDQSGFSSSLNYGEPSDDIKITLQIMRNDNYYVVTHDCK